MTVWMKTLSVVTLTAAGLGLTANTALAHGPGRMADRQEQRVDHRQHRQAARIEQGVESGQLTAREQARLQHQQQHINRLERHTEADGHVTAQEALRMEKAQDRASRQIYRQKHDRQQRGG